jgi:hypothetical protein
VPGKHARALFGPSSGKLHSGFSSRGCRAQRPWYLWVVVCCLAAGAPASAHADAGVERVAPAFLAWTSAWPAGRHYLTREQAFAEHQAIVSDLGLGISDVVSNLRPCPAGTYKTRGGTSMGCRMTGVMTSPDINTRSSFIPKQPA